MRPVTFGNLRYRLYITKQGIAGYIVGLSLPARHAVFARRARLSQLNADKVISGDLTQRGARDNDKIFAGAI
jgi:hypothetical protein